MATILMHRGVRIMTFEEGDSVAALCRSGDIVLEQGPTGWWTRFIGEGNAVEDYDTAFESYQKALWTAKAAAEFQAE